MAGKEVEVEWMTSSAKPKRWFLMSILCGCAALLILTLDRRHPLPAAAVQARAFQPLDIEPEDVRPGLLAAYRSLVDRDTSFSRPEPKPAFYLGNSSPHPRLPPGPFEVTWSGLLLIKENAPLSFHAFVGGEVSVELDAVTVLQGRGATDSSRIGPKETLKHSPGYYRLAIRFRALPDVPARLQMFWESPIFAREPLPAWRLFHVPKELPAEAKTEELAARGRIVA